MAVDTSIGIVSVIRTRHTVYYVLWMVFFSALQTRCIYCIYRWFWNWPNRLHSFWLHHHSFWFLTFTFCEREKWLRLLSLEYSIICHS